MTRKLCLIVCSHFEREVRALSTHPDFQGVRFLFHPVECDQCEAKWPGLEKSVANCRKEGSSICLIGSFCLNQAASSSGLEEACPSVQKSLCFEWLVDKEILDRYLQDGAYFLSPGWLSNWGEFVEKRWGSDRKKAQAYFRETARKLVLLDTGLHPEISGVLGDFARFVRLPVDIYPVGLGYLRLGLSRLVMQWKLEGESQVRDDRMDEIRQKMAAYTKIGGLLGAVNKAQAEEDVLGSVSKILSSLMSSSKVKYHSLSSLSRLPKTEDSPLDRILSLNADYSWSGDRKSLYLKVGIGRETFGAFEISGVGSAEEKDQAFNMGMTAAGVAGLALANMRSYRTLREEREKAQNVEAALKVSEEKIKSVFENVPVGIYRTTASGQIVDANPMLADMLGYPDVAALKAVNTKDLHLNVADRELWKSLLNSNGFIENFETQLRRLDGTVIWVKDTARAVKDSRGQVVFFDGSLEDITKRKQTESALSWNWRMKEAISELSSQLLSPTKIEDMSSLVLEHARRLTGSKTCFVGYVDRQTGKLLPAAMTPDAKKMLEEHPELAEDTHESSGLWGWAIKGMKPLLANVPGLDPRYTGMPEWHFPVGQFLAVPAVMAGTLVGVISVANSERPFAEQDLEVVERLATLYAIAVDRTRTEEELRELSLVD